MEKLPNRGEAVSFCSLRQLSIPAISADIPGHLIIADLFPDQMQESADPRTSGVTGLFVREASLAGARKSAARKLSGDFGNFFRFWR